MIDIRGGKEAFYAHPYDREQVIEAGEQVQVIEYRPPRTVLVVRYPVPPGEQVTQTR